MEKDLAITIEIPYLVGFTVAASMPTATVLNIAKLIRTTFPDEHMYIRGWKPTLYGHRTMLSPVTFV